MYNRAKQAFDQGNTAQARRGFEELIQRYPNSAAPTTPSSGSAKPSFVRNPTKKPSSNTRK